MPSIRIPASTANMGSGFDSIGMALSLFNEISFEVIPRGLEIITDDPSVPQDDSNLIVRSIAAGLEATGIPMPGLRIWQKDRIPQTRGLGSSSACVVGGIVAANILSDAVLSTDEMIDIAVRIEGHPDNVLPTFIGGMTVGAMENSHVRFVHVEPPRELKCCALIPDFKLSTTKARGVLPEQVPLQDAIYNVSRAALLTGAMTQGRMDLVRTALGDALHEPYRKQLIPGFDEMVAAAEKNGAIGCCLSGAGPTLIAFLDRDYRQFIQRIKIFTAQMENNWRVELLDICYSGVSWDLD